MICMLKQAASAEGMKQLLIPSEGEDIQALYAHFCALQTEAFSVLSAELPGLSPMTCAVRNAGYRLLCNFILTKDAAAAASKEEETE